MTTLVCVTRRSTHAIITAVTIRFWKSAFLGFGIVVLAGCADAFTRDAAVDSFLAANDDATRVQASCVVGELIDEYGLDGLKGELDRERVDPAFELSQFRASFNCGMTADVEQTLVDELVDTGIERDEAVCAADALLADFDDSDLDVLLSGELNETFYAKYFDALEQCDALPNS